MQFAFFDKERRVRGNRVNGVGSDLHSIFGRSYRHRRMFGEKPGHVAHMGRIQMLDHHKRHAVVGRHGDEKSFNASSPPADAPMPTT